MADHQSDSRNLLRQREKFLSNVFDSGRPDAVKKQHQGGRLTARERITTLCDDGSYREIGDLVEPVRDTAFNANLVAPADGVIIGSGQLDGRPAIVTAHDFTVLGGGKSLLSGKVSETKFGSTKTLQSNTLTFSRPAMPQSSTRMSWQSSANFLSV